MSAFLMPVETERLAELLHGKATENSLTLPENLTEGDWQKVGDILGEFNKVGRYSPWWIGDWWNFGEHKYGDRKALTESSDWKGPAYQTCRNAAWVCAKFEMSRRRDNLSFSHYQDISRLDKKKADKMIEWCLSSVATTGKVRSKRELRQRIKLGDVPEQLANGDLPKMVYARQPGSPAIEPDNTPPPPDGQLYPVLFTAKEVNLLNRGLSKQSSQTEVDKAFRALAQSLRKRGNLYVTTDLKAIRRIYGRSSWKQQ